ncbi:hypothetical protein CB0940_11820 [Cercospora beticola]|uniref:Phosphatidylinositol N-acetylglucosaminyltransferase subunit H conserved domain-containing protein n=1 Tax=Cercospora beticola TaxID=122368 RepID=A0A2G5IFE9_CERBT|nr:hypothetical protein CB0940_11820 [Cercospora beticola]PIB03193.1 hypothetical protein CB0940_11820 [Cercospora beticola]WPB04180.1 hypothetical protein RHO25_008825 [Cercospora beticola]
MLTTKRPTETTVLYTVSTQSPSKTIISRLGTTISLSLRILAGLLILASLVLEYDQALNKQAEHQDAGNSLVSLVVHSPLGQVAKYLFFTSLSGPWRLAIYLITFLLIFRRGHTEESLLVIRGLGVQTTTSSPNYLWTNSTRFIPTSLIQDIFIYEAFKGFEVRYYLSIVVEGEEDVVVVFPVYPVSSEARTGTF